MRTMDTVVRDWYEGKGSDQEFDNFEERMFELAGEQGLWYRSVYSTQNGMGMYEMFITNAGNVTDEADVNYKNSIVEKHDHVTLCEDLMKYGYEETAEMYFNNFMNKHKEELGV